jgi:uncharacterized protein YicC (UPF0701 family)
VNVTLRLTARMTRRRRVWTRRALNAALDALMQVRTVAEERGIALAAPTAAEILNLRAMHDSVRAGMSCPRRRVFLPMPTRSSRLRGDAAGRGGALATVLGDQIDRIAERTVAARAAAQVRRSDAGGHLPRQPREALLEASDIDEARLAQELALLAVKSDVMEELDRLDAHVAAARDLLTKGGAIGRKFDFLMQEFNREANTLCSKSQDAALTAIGLDLKLAIDQTREQVQNVE